MAMNCTSSNTYFGFPPEEYQLKGFVVGFITLIIVLGEAASGLIFNKGHLILFNYDHSIQTQS